MADPRFFERGGPLSLAALAGISATRLLPEDAGARLVHDVAPLETAGPDDLTFLDNPKYLGAFQRCRAGAACVDQKFVDRAPSGMALLVGLAPYQAYARAAQALYPVAPPVPGRAASALIDPAASVPEDCEIAANAVIERGARLGRRCRVGAGAVVGAAVEIGDDCRIGANVTLSHCLIGARVVLYPGVRIGQDGFGFAPHKAGPIKVPQLGRVLVGDDVEIGANTTIDRGSGHDTVIGAGSMIDNLVQIGHNVVLGRCCVLAAQVGIAGSTRLGDFVMVGGQTGLAGHLRVGSGARIGAKSGVMRDIAEGETVIGIPARPMTEFFRQTAALRRLGKKRGGQ